MALHNTICMETNEAVAYSRKHKGFQRTEGKVMIEFWFSIYGLESLGEKWVMGPMMVSEVSEAVASGEKKFEGRKGSLPSGTELHFLLVVDEEEDQRL